MQEVPFHHGPAARQRRDEINILFYLELLRRRALLIFILTFAGVALTAGWSTLLEDRYIAKAVISPVKEGGGPSSGVSVLVQQIESVPGISLSSASSSSEILALLNSNMLRKKAIERFDLLPILFPDRWDAAEKGWADAKTEPSVHDGLRALEKVITLKHSPRDNTITITGELANGRDAAMLLENLLETLNSHLSSEAKRIAESNRRYLEGQLNNTADPLIRQNIYSLIAQQIESAMMAGVMENFAFKVIDPPDAPDRKSSPRRHVIVAAGFVISLAAGVVLSFVLEFFKARREQNFSDGPAAENNLMETE